MVEVCCHAHQRMPAKGHETPEEAEARSALEDTRAFAAARDALLREVEGHYFGQASGFVVAVVKIQRVERGVVGLDGITRHRVVFDAVVLRLIEGSIVDAMVEKVVDDVSVIASNGILTAIVRLPAADMRVVRASMDDPTLYRTPIRFMIDGGELTFHARQKMHCVGSTLPPASQRQGAGFPRAQAPGLPPPPRRLPRLPQDHGRMIA